MTIVKVYILVVHLWATGGPITFQEFNSLESCQANANYIKKKLSTDLAYCTEK